MIYLLLGTIILSAPGIYCLLKGGNGKYILLSYILTTGIVLVVFLIFGTLK